MADTVGVQTILNGPRNILLKLVNSSDGTGETLVKKFDAQSTTYGVTVQGQVFLPGVHAKLERIEYDVRGAGAGVDLFWDATTPDLMLALSGAGTISLDEPYQFINTMAAGATGSILLSTKTFAAGSGYTITLHLTKNVPRS